MIQRLISSWSLIIFLPATILIIIYVINTFTIKNDFLTNWILLPGYILLAILYFTISLIEKLNEK